MPLAGISIGKDIVVTFNDTNGNVVTCRVKNFTSKQKVANKETIALDGVNRHLNIPMGWEGSFEMERDSPAMDNYIANIEALYYTGGTIPAINITETITEATGLTSQYLYTQCVINLDSAGDWKGDDLTTQKLMFSASARDIQA